MRPTIDEYTGRGRRLIRGRALLWAVIGAAFLYATWETGFGFLTLFQGVAISADFIGSDFLPPDLDAIGPALGPALETLYMSYVAMILSVVLSVPLGVLAARNTTVHQAVALLARANVAFIRAAPELVLAIFLVAVLGIGPLAGTLAMGIGGIGILAKAYADGIEAVDMAQVEGIRAAGGSWLQALCQGVWPQFKPTFVSWSLYRLDLNIREAAVLGFLGAGGLGYTLQRALSLFQYRTATTVILMIFAMILLVEAATGALRKRAL